MRTTNMRRHPASRLERLLARALTPSLIQRGNGPLLDLVFLGRTVSANQVGVTSAVEFDKDF